MSGPLLPMVAVLAAKGPDPSTVKPGWLAFVVFLVMAAAVVVLYLSLRKQLRKVDFEEKPEDEPPTREPPRRR